MKLLKIIYKLLGVLMDIGTAGLSFAMSFTILVMNYNHTIESSTLVYDNWFVMLSYLNGTVALLIYINMFVVILGLLARISMINAKNRYINDMVANFLMLITNIYVLLVQSNSGDLITIIFASLLCLLCIGRILVESGIEYMKGTGKKCFQKKN